MKNYINFVHSGFDNILFHQDGVLHRKLSRIAFEIHGDHWDPFNYGQKTYAFNMAVKFKIPLMFYGENGEVEYGGSLKYADKPCESPEDWDYLYFKGGGIDRLAEQGVNMGILSKEDAAEKRLVMYKAPPLEEIAKLGAQMHWWSYYHKWIPQENYYYAAKHTGFEANPDGLTLTTDSAHVFGTAHFQQMVVQVVEG